MPLVFSARNEPRSADPRKLLFLILVTLSVAYFTVVNVFFALPSAQQQMASGAINNNVVHIVKNPIVLDSSPHSAKLKDSNTAEKSPVKTMKSMTMMKTTATQAPLKWKRNSDRRYVWLDVSIDDKSVGRVTIELYYDLTPKTAENFRVLTTGERGPALSFKNSVCHRVISNFLVQCGDFTKGDGTGGQSIFGGAFDDEPNALRLKHSKRYLLTMANSGPNTNTSQFCFMFIPADFLDGAHSVFGEVVDGFEVIDAIEKVGVEKDDIPLTHKVVLMDGGELKFDSARVIAS